MPTNESVNGFRKVDMDTPRELAPDESLRAEPFKLTDEELYLAVPVFLHRRIGAGIWYPRDTLRPGLIHKLGRETSISVKNINNSLLGHEEIGAFEIRRPDEYKDRKRVPMTAVLLTDHGDKHINKVLQDKPDVGDHIAKYAFAARAVVAETVIEDILGGFKALGVEPYDFPNPRAKSLEDLETYLKKLQGIQKKVHTRLKEVRLQATAIKIRDALDKAN